MDAELPELGAARSVLRPSDDYPLTTMTPNDVSQLVESMCEGNENAFHTLIEADKAIIPLLVQQFTSHTCGADRARITEVIWQHRERTTIPFLASALHDPDSDVWRTAIDGLVALGGIEAHNALLEYRSNISTYHEHASWVNEAIGQVHH